jgi:hypothetical protein
VPWPRNSLRRCSASPPRGEWSNAYSYRATGATIADVIIEFMDNDKGYVAWLAEHPNGYVLNCERPPRPSSLTLHRATCWTISRASGTNWTVNYQKVCADTFEEINAWAGQIGPPWSCGFCAHR